MKTVVFVGPSLAGEIPASTDTLTFLPPAQQGDVIGAAFDGVERIVLIDGYFGQHLSVWHKEILEALRRGVDVIGAASMGALRALECEAYGMRGVGRVFAMFKRGLIANDDEVALAHAGAEHGWVNLSKPLVNVRMTIAWAVRECLEHAYGEELIKRAERIFYADRKSFRQIAQNPEEGAWLDRNYVDVKRLDALEAVELARGGEALPIGKRLQVDLVRHGGLLDEDRVVTVAGQDGCSVDRVRVRNLGFPPLLDEVGFLRAAGLRLAVELGIDRAQCLDEMAQAVEDDRVLERLREWMGATGYRAESSRQRVFAAAKAARHA